MRGCAACAAAPIGETCSLEHAELVRDVLSLIAGRGEAENGPDSTGEPSRRASPLLQLHIEKALECLTHEFNAGGISGLRAVAIMHLRLALTRLGPAT